jgi:DNA repair exonuclease SbcCD ATPase subunit
LQKRYEKLQEQLPKVEERIKQQEKELEGFRERYEKKEGIFKERLRVKDEEFKRLEKNLRNAGEREVFQGRLQKKMDARDVCIQKYSTALSELENRMELVTGKLKKELVRKEKIVNELENIDLEAKFFQLNTASTTFSIAVKEAVANANSELTRQISHDGQPMKVSRAKKVLYKLPGKITVDSSTKIVELAPIRNRPLRKRFERLCNWLTEKGVEDTDGKRLVFKVATT